MNLGTLIYDIRYGTGTPPLYMEPSKETVPFVRATDIKNGEVNFNKLFHIAAEQPTSLNKCRLSGGELIIVRSGVNTGDCAVIPKSLNNAYAAYDLIVTFNAQVLVEYVSAFLDTKIGRLQIDLVKGRAAQPHINADEVVALRIPVPSMDIQKRFVANISAASRQRADKICKADELLASMDDVVREMIGLPEEIKTRSMFFAAKISPKEMGRIDPEFHNPFYQHRVERIKDVKHDTLENIIEFSSETWNQKSDFEDTFPYIEISRVGIKTNDYEITQMPVAETPSRAKMKVRNGDIIVSMTRPHRGAIATITCDDGYYVASTGFCVLRGMKRNDVSREYLQWILLNDYVLQQLLQRSSGGNYPAIIQNVIKKVVVPIPDKNIQDKIVK